MPDKAKLILECVSGKEHTVKTVILMEAFDPDLVIQGQKSGISILSLAEFEVRVGLQLALQYRMVCGNILPLMFHRLIYKNVMTIMV